MADLHLVWLTVRNARRHIGVAWGGCVTGEDTLAQIESLGAGRPAAPLSPRDFRPESCETELLLTPLVEADRAGWDRAEQFIYSVFRDAGFCARSRRRWVEETDAYRAGSTLHVARSEGDVVGCIRTQLGTYDNLPIGQFKAEVPVPDGILCEFGSLAVHPSVRGLGVVNELHRAAVQWSMRQRANGFCMLVEPWSVEFFRDAYGVPLVQTAVPRKYMGSKTVPAMVTFDALFDHLLAERPGMYRWAVEGLAPADLEAYGIPILLP